MGIIDTQLTELAIMTDQIKKGSISTKDVIKRIAVYNQSEKRMRLLVQIEALSCMNPSLSTKKLPILLAKL